MSKNLMHKGELCIGLVWSWKRLKLQSFESGNIEIPSNGSGNSRHQAFPLGAHDTRQRLRARLRSDNWRRLGTRKAERHLRRLPGVTEAR